MMSGNNGPFEHTVFAGLSRRNRGDHTAERHAAKLLVKLVRQLRRAGRRNKRARKLANKLDRCSPKDPCWSGACPVCGLAVRRHLTGEVRRFLRDHDSSGEVVAISIVVPSAVVPIGELNRFSPANFARRLKYAFDQADVGWLVGCIDYSVNFHEAERYEPHWSVHLHGFTVTDDQQALRRRLVEAVRKSDAIPRPVRVTPWDGSKKAIRYALKTKFQRRKGVDNARRFNATNGTWRTCRATKTQRLLAAENLELAMHLDRVGWEGRLFMRHAQLRRSQAGPIIVLMNNR